MPPGIIRITNNVNAQPFTLGPVIRPIGLVIQALLGVPGINITGGPAEPLFVQGADTSIFFDDFEAYSNAQSFVTIGGWNLASNFPQLTAPVGSGIAGGKSAQIIWGIGDNFVGLSHAVGAQVGRTTIVTWLYKAQNGFAFVGPNVDQIDKQFLTVFPGPITVSAHDVFGSAVLRLSLQPVSGGGGILTFETNPAVLAGIVDNAYHRLTLKRVAESSIGASDGSLELWVNGVRVLVGINLPTGTSSITDVGLGGAFAGGSTQTQTEAYDQIRVWTSGTTASLLFPSIPVYDAGNPDHVSHVFEDWNYSSAAVINTSNRSDGGGHWDNGAAAFQTISASQVDPWFGVKRLIIDYTPPVVGGASLQRGLDMEEFGGSPPQYLNRSAAKVTVNIEYAFKFDGAPYVGKIADWQPYAGTDRFNFQSGRDCLGAQMIANHCDDDTLGLCPVYYSGSLPSITPVFPGMNPPPSPVTQGWAFARSRPPVPPAPEGTTFFYPQNVNYGTGPGLIAVGGSGDVDNGANFADGVWRRVHIRLSMNEGDVAGRGRMEVWIQKAGENAVKVMEYVGDLGQLAANKVYGRDTFVGTHTWITDSATLHFFNLTAPYFAGGCTLSLGYVRIWTQSKPVIGAPEPNYYTRNFATLGNEALLSDGGKWAKLGKRDGINWDDVQCLNGRACGVYVNSQLVEFADPTAVLAGTWALNQEAEGIIQGVDALSESCNQEIEIRLRTSVSANTNLGYEIVLQMKSFGGHYMGITKFNGPFGSFTGLAAATNFPIANGMVFRARVTTQGANALIQCYLDNVLIVDYLDPTPINTGNPGMGFYISPFGSPGCFSSPSAFGFSSFTARELP